MMCSQLSPACFLALQQYQTALDERNALLRESRKTGIAPDQGMMEAFEQTMAVQAAVIIRMRRRLMNGMKPIAEAKYTAISGRSGEPFGVRYVCCVGDDVP